MPRKAASGAKASNVRGTGTPARRNARVVSSLSLQVAVTAGALKTGTLQLSST